MSKAAKPDAAQTNANSDAENAADATDAPPKKKSKKKLIITFLALLVLIGGGAAAYLLLVPADPSSLDEAAVQKAEEEARSKNPPKYVDLGTFTANLVREDGDRYLQVTISLKIAKPELEERIKANSPEILHHVNMVLQSKRPSDINTFEGKNELAEHIKGQVEYVLGMRKTPPAISSEQSGTTPAGTGKIRSDITEVLFTSFIIQ